MSWTVHCFQKKFNFYVLLSTPWLMLTPSDARVNSVFQPYEFMKRRGSQTFSFPILLLFHRGLNSTAHDVSSVRGLQRYILHASLTHTCGRDSLRRFRGVLRFSWCSYVHHCSRANAIVFHTGRDGDMQRSCEACSLLYRELHTHVACFADPCAVRSRCERSPLNVGLRKTEDKVTQ